MTAALQSTGGRANWPAHVKEILGNSCARMKDQVGEGWVAQEWVMKNEDRKQWTLGEGLMQHRARL